MNLGMYPTVAVPRQEAFAAGGRLTLVKNTPVISSDQSAKTQVFYTPDKYAAFPVIKNGIIRPVYFNDDLVLGLNSSFVSNAIYDVFGLEDGRGGGKLVAGVAWTTATAGSGDRGATAGSTELTRVAGMRVNKWPMAGMNAEGPTFIPALEGRYMGSIYIDANAGQVTCNISAGQGTKWGVWNTDNRREIIIQQTDPTPNWSYNATTFAYRSANQTADNVLYTFTGLPEERLNLRYGQRCVWLVNNATTSLGNAIGFNSTNSPSGQIGSATGGESSVVSQGGGSVTAAYQAPPSIGVNRVFPLEWITAPTAATQTFFGTETNMLLTARYLG